MTNAEEDNTRTSVPYDTAWAVARSAGLLSGPALLYSGLAAGPATEIVESSTAYLALPHHVYRLDRG